jgi:hypothetical protein
MNIMTRRNAVIGYLALQALKRARRNATVGYLAAQGMEHTRARRRNRRALKLALYTMLGIASFGILAAAAGFAKRKKSAAETLDAPDADASPVEEATPASVETEPVVAT